MLKSFIPSWLLLQLGLRFHLLQNLSHLDELHPKIGEGKHGCHPRTVVAHPREDTCSMRALKSPPCTHAICSYNLAFHLSMGTTLHHWLCHLEIEELQPTTRIIRLDVTKSYVFEIISNITDH